MASEISSNRFSGEAAADLSAKQYRFVKFDAAGLIALCGDGELGIGILQNNPTAGQTAEVWGPGLISKIEQSATLTIGAGICSDANGKAQAFAASKNTLGILRENGGADARFGSCLIALMGKES